jgi:two-component system cell cycle sensor histidine kinase/response regulator CckA
MSKAHPRSNPTWPTRAIVYLAEWFRQRSPGQVIGAFAVITFLFSLFLLGTGLPSSMLYLGLVPIMLSALYQKRRIVYLANIVLLSLAALWTAWYISIDFVESLKTILLTVISVLALSEVVYSLSATRRQVEAALRESEARYRALFDASPSALSISKMAVDGGQYVEVNESFLQMSGYRRQQVIGKSPLELNMWYDAQQRVQLLETIERDGFAYGAEIQIRYADGTVSTGLVSAQLISLGGEPHVLASIQDIAERKRIEEALRTSNQFLDSVLQNSPSSIFVRDLEGRYLLVNRQYQYVIDRTTEQAIGRQPEELHSPQAAAQIAQYDAQILETGMPVTVEESVLVDDEPHTFIATTVPLYDVAGQVYAFCTLATDITEHKRAQEALRQSQAQLRAMLSSMPVVLWAVDRKGIFILSEGSALSSIGLRSGQAVGESVWEMYKAYPEILHDVRCALNGDTLLVVHSIQGMVFETRLVPLFGQTGQVDGAIGVSIDITDRQKAQAAQRESAILLEATLNAIPDLIGIQGPDRRIIRYNEAGYQMLHKTPEEVIGTKCHEVIGREFPCDICATTHAYETKQPAQVERYEPSLGIWLDARAYPILDEQGNITKVIEHLRDITDRKRAEQALRESQKFLQDVFDAIQDGISVLDTDFTILQVNRWMEELYQDHMPLIGKKCFDVYQHRSSICRRCPATKTIESGQVQAEIVPYPDADTPNGWFELSTFPLQDEHGAVTGVIEYVKDITLRIKAEEEKEKLQERLVQSQKMEAIGRLAGGIAHDFNNMLTAIQGYTEFLTDAFAQDTLQTWPSGTEVRADLNEIMAAANRAQSLTAQLLAFSRKQMLRPQIISVAETLSNIERMLRRLIGEDIELSEYVMTDHDYVQADPGQLEQILLNLAVNARDAMSDGGQLIFEIDHVAIDEAFAKAHPDLKPGNYVRLSITDTGVGMSDEVKSHLFEPFFTTKDVGKGTGLGLATVYAIVDQLGGDIGVYSEENVGTTFKIYLPSVDKPQMPQAQSVLESQMPTGTETILLAEDEQMVRDLIRRILTRCGYTVLTAERPNEALMLGQEHPASINLLITDVVMPQIGGKELAARLVSSHPEAQVLFISGYTDNAIVHHGVLDEGVNFIQKPFSPSSLAIKVREILDCAG